jgi:hypothetical protein
MRAREVGGYEPDDREQTELVELWHLSRTALAGRTSAMIAMSGFSLRSARINWCVDEFLKKHDGEPHVARKWIYVWAVDNLGLMVVEARTVTVKDAWGHERVVGGFGDVGGSKRSTDHEKG